MQLNIRMDRKTLAVGAVVLTIGLVLAVATYSRTKHAQSPPVPVRVQVVEGAGETSGLRYSANITPREQVELAFKVGGYVHEITAVPGPDGIKRELRAGDHVTRGMVLARLDPQDHAARVNQARAALDEAKASLVQAKKNFERSQSLVVDGYLAKSEFDLSQERLGVARAKVDGARAQLEQASIMLADSQLKSPLDGMVASRSVEHGTLVSSGTKAFVLVDLSSVKAVFGVPDSMQARIKRGAPLSVLVEALGGREFAGTVTAVSPSADAKSRVFDIELTIPNPDAQLKDGMIATVRLEGLGATAPEAVQDGQSVQVLASVPLQSVVRPPDDPNGYMVFVVEDVSGQTVARAKRVELGDVTGRSVLVRGGVRPGQRIVTNGATLIHDGAAVTIVP
ncbi:MAG: efflux RND transporter periplasmic adaptor subunit [Deltaproteobacteria bacterium HGW-Deltaproteobacteria-8]|jgi:RND family efflux transporter MFP subunit|nr:MAG: efflux RND transporter periplasmic adaptor subunit [Deltaproteobacteria bacterium HGW-Deltaproteobacteria-8]